MVMVKSKVCTALCGVIAGAAVAGTVTVISENAISLASGGRMSASPETLPSLDSRTKTVVCSNASNIDARKQGLFFCIR
mgnify:CR=1 FL=1